MRTKLHVLAFIALTLLLSGCGGGGDNPLDVFEGDAGATGTDGKSTLMAVSAEAPGGQCAAGGSKIDAGLDANANGLLDANEVTSTQYVCSGASGAGAASILVQMLDEPSGANCAVGGKAINVGLDGNANGALDAGEVSSSGYVCNGSGGTNGVGGASGINGANGLSTLISITIEPAGATCVYGGNKISSGVDTNANSALDANEVGATNYTCNGAPSAALNWVNVTGAGVHAVRNTSYIANSDAQVVVTLPIDDLLAVGDVVRINGAGAGGWKIAQNDGQVVNTRNLGGMAGANWTLREPSFRFWNSVASSADGSKLVAVVWRGQIYTSTDSGVNWVPSVGANAAPTEYWISVASSADGNKLVAVAYGGQIYTSIDSGANWTPREVGRDWLSVASSADGSKLVAVVEHGQIFTSADSGANWTPRGSGRDWASVASSADGSKLVAVTSGDQIFTSTDYGANWTPRAFAQNWSSVASSADGSKLVAVIDTNGPIYTSTDSGVNWTSRDSGRWWVAVASSADGTRLVALAYTGQIYTSTDSGVNWTARDSDRRWFSVASSADGSKLVAAVYGGEIYTSTATTTLGTGGSISGGASDAIELQYVGNGMFNVSSHEGTLIIE